MGGTPAGPLGGGENFQGGPERLGGIRGAVNGWSEGISLELGICGA